MDAQAVDVEALKKAASSLTIATGLAARIKKD